MSYNKNVSNQSGLRVDNVNVNNTVILPSGSTIDSTSGASFNSVLVAKAGIQLPSGSYTINNYYLGYQPTLTYANLLMNSNAGYGIIYVTLTPGTYILRGQVEYFCYYGTANITFIKTSIYLNGENHIKSPISLVASETFIHEVTSIVTIVSTNTYSLNGLVTYTGGGSIMSRSKSDVTTSVSLGSIQTSVTNCVIQSANGLIQVSMQCSGTGITQPCYVLSYGGSTTVTLTTTQTIAANTTLTFNYSNAGSKLSAVRIA